MSILTEEDLEEIEALLGYELDYDQQIQAQRLASMGAHLRDIAIELKYGEY